MPPKSGKGAKAGGASAAAKQAAALAAAVDHFKANYMDNNDPTGPVWGALRPFLMAQFRHGILNTTPEAPDLPLFNVHDFAGPIQHTLPSTCSALSSATGTTQKRWPLTVALAAEGSQRRDFATIEVFKEQLNQQTLGAFKYVDFAKYKCIVAGGVVEACLRAPEPGTAAAASLPADDPRATGDADVFFYGIKTWKEVVERASAVGGAILRGLVETPGVEAVRLERRTGTVNIYAHNAAGETVGRPIQLVLLGSKYPSASRVIHGFDLCSVQFGWQGNEVLATWKGLRAWVFQANLVDVEHLSASHRGGRVLYGDLNISGRLWKYYKRGYSVAVPGITAAALEAARAEAAAAPNANDLHGLPELLWLHDHPPQNLEYQVVNLHFGERGYAEDAFEYNVWGPGAEALKKSISEDPKGDYRMQEMLDYEPFDPNASAESAVRKVIKPSPFLGGFDESGGFNDTIELPWITNLSALAYQKSWASGKEDGITAGIRLDQDECVIC